MYKNDRLIAPRVVVIILNWNGCDDTLACLASFEEVDYPNYHIILVDNGSIDGSISSIKKIMASKKNFKLIELNDNYGFVEANNIGIDVGQGEEAEYYLLLNNDTIVSPNFLQSLVEVMDSDLSIGAVGPYIFYYDEPNIIWSAGGSIDRIRGRTLMIGINHPILDPSDLMPKKVDFVTGCALMIRASVIDQIGKLDPRFFAYHEEVEWCERINKGGYKIFVVPRSKIWHKVSVKKRASSPSVHYYMIRNRILFLKAARLGFLAWFYTLIIDDLRMLISWSIKPRWRERRKLLRSVTIRAIFDGLFNRWGKRDIKVSS